MILICIALIISDIEDLFMNMLVIWENIYSGSLVTLKIDLLSC